MVTLLAWLVVQSFVLRGGDPLTFDVTTGRTDLNAPRHIDLVAYDWLVDDDPTPVPATRRGCWQLSVNPMPPLDFACAVNIPTTLTAGPHRLRLVARALDNAGRSDPSVEVPVVVVTVAPPGGVWWGRP